MIIDTMFVHYFVDPDLGVEIFFEKEESKEKRNITLEIVDLGTTAHLY